MLYLRKTFNLFLPLFFLIFYSITTLFFDAYAILANEDSGDVYYSPISGSKPIAYFADATASSQLDKISLEFDVNIVQAVTANVTVNVTLMDSNGQTVDSQSLSYKTFFDDLDYKNMEFKPIVEDAYSFILTVYPEGGAADSRIIGVIWPPGTGAYFRIYETQAFDDRIEVAFDVDLEYNITYPVVVEAILYNSYNDAVAYGYNAYLTTGILIDEHKIILSPKVLVHDRYYAELIVYVDGYPASYGYIADIPFGKPRWDINSDKLVDVRDLIIISKEFGKKTTELVNPMADVNIDGIVDLLDLVIVGYHFGESW